jgi:hypothetical protein
MKKILAVLLTTGALASVSFAGGLTQLELAELLVTKASAENLIEQKDYTDEEIIELVTNYELMKITDASAEVDISEVRTVLGDYETKKLTIKPDAFTESEKVAMVEEDEYAALLKLDRKLSHEFMEMKSEDRELYEENLDGIGNVDGQRLHYDDYEYPLIDKYIYELYRIFGWYAKEYDLYVKKTPVSVALYGCKNDFILQANPLIIVGFDQSPTDDNDDGIAYSIRMKVNALYYVEELPGDKLGDKRKRIEATGFKQPHLVMALKDVSNIFIKDKITLNAFVESYVADVVENEGKEYTYGKRRHEYFGNTRYYISKIQGVVFYYIDHDLSKWED